MKIQRTVKFGKNNGSNIILETKEFKAFRFFVTYGGGMGGGNQSFYVKSKDYESNGSEILIKNTICNEKNVWLNKRYIAFIKPMKIIEITEKTKDNEIFTTYYAIEQFENYVVKDEYVGDYENLGIFKKYLK